jgi:hypothetical protein
MAGLGSTRRSPEVKPAPVTCLFVVGTDHVRELRLKSPSFADPAYSEPLRLTEMDTKWSTVSSDNLPTITPPGQPPGGFAGSEGEPGDRCAEDG